MCHGFVKLRHALTYLAPADDRKTTVWEMKLFEVNIETMRKELKANKTFFKTYCTTRKSEKTRVILRFPEVQ